MAENICLRPAKLEDARLFFKWANDPGVRKNSFNSATIEWNEHITWFQRALTDDDIQIFVLMIEGIPAGQIRLAKSKRWQISYSIAPAYRGQGYGRILLRLAENELFSAGHEGEELLAEVKTENIASQRIFVGLGYQKTDTQNNEAYTYVKAVEYEKFKDGVLKSTAGGQMSSC